MQVKAVLTAACLLGSALAQNKIKIMPLGDSITEATCWRALLWDKLVAAGVADKIDFVGSKSSKAKDCQAKSAWDVNHEGHSGFLATDIAEKNQLVVWLQAAKPDVVVFMLGTNDIGHKNLAPDAITKAYTKLVGDMRTSNPNMQIFVDTVIPRPDKANQTNALNAAIPRWAKEISTDKSPIRVIDINAAYPQDQSGLRDGVHPNAVGDRIIADQLAPVLERVARGEACKMKRSWVA